MDVVSIPDLNKFFRVMPSQKGLLLNPVSKKEASFKLCRVEDRTTVKNGCVQIALHDGSNMLVKVADLKSPSEVTYETFDTLKLSLPEKQVLAHLKTKEGNLAVITGGKNIGKQGRIVEIEKAEAKKRRNALVVIEDEKGIRYQTILGFVFSIGEAQPLILSSEGTALV
jgi:small subunit ribosomal protein S4e